MIDSNRPGDVILTFDILGANVLCIASVSGVKDYDYSPAQEIIPDVPVKADSSSDPEKTSSAAKESGEEQTMGSIRYVSCSVAGSDLPEQPKDNEAEGTWLNQRRCSVSGQRNVKCIF